jgi:hypothetical protein
VQRLHPRGDPLAWKSTIKIHHAATAIHPREGNGDPLGAEASSGSTPGMNCGSHEGLEPGCGDLAVTPSRSAHTLAGTPSRNARTLAVTPLPRNPRSKPTTQLPLRSNPNRHEHQDKPLAAHSTSQIRTPPLIPEEDPLEITRSFPGTSTPAPLTSPRPKLSTLPQNPPPNLPKIPLTPRTQKSHLPSHPLSYRSHTPRPPLPSHPTIPAKTISPPQNLSGSPHPKLPAPQ